MSRTRPRRAASRRAKTDAEEAAEQPPSSEHDNEDEDDEEQAAEKTSTKPSAESATRRSTRTRRKTAKTKGQTSIVSYLSKKPGSNNEDEAAENDEFASEEESAKKDSNLAATSMPRRSKRKRTLPSRLRDESNGDQDENGAEGEQLFSDESSAAKKESADTGRSKRKKASDGDSDREGKDETDKAQEVSAEQLPTGGSSHEETGRKRAPTPTNADSDSKEQGEKVEAEIEDHLEHSSSAESPDKKQSGPTRRLKRKRATPSPDELESQGEAENDKAAQDVVEQSSSEESFAEKGSGPTRRSKRKRTTLSSKEGAPEKDENDETEQTERTEQLGAGDSSVKEENALSESKRSKRRNSPLVANDKDDKACVLDTDEGEQDSEKLIPTETSKASTREPTPESPTPQGGSNNENNADGLDEQDAAPEEGRPLSKFQQDQLVSKDQSHKDEHDDEQDAPQEQHKKPQQDHADLEDAASKVQPSKEQAIPEKGSEPSSKPQQEKMGAASEGEHYDVQDVPERGDSSKPLQVQIIAEEEPSQGVNSIDQDTSQQEVSEPQHDQVDTDDVLAKKPQETQVSSGFDMLAAICGDLQSAPVDRATEVAKTTRTTDKSQGPPVDLSSSQVYEEQGSLTSLHAGESVKSIAVTASPDCHSPSRTAQNETVERKGSEQAEELDKEVESTATEQDNRVNGPIEKKELASGSLSELHKTEAADNRIRQISSQPESESPSVASALIALAAVAADTTTPVSEPVAKPPDSTPSDKEKGHDDSGNLAVVEVQKEKGVSEASDAIVPEPSGQLQNDRRELTKEATPKAGPSDIVGDNLSDEVEERGAGVSPATRVDSANEEHAKDTSMDTSAEIAEEKLDAGGDTNYQGQQQQNEGIENAQGGEACTIEGETGEQDDTEQLSADSPHVQPQVKPDETEDSKQELTELSPLTEDPKEKRQEENAEKHADDTDQTKDEEQPKDEVTFELDRTSSGISTVPKETTQTADGDGVESEKPPILDTNTEKEVRSIETEKQKDQVTAQTTELRSSTPNGGKEAAPVLIDQDVAVSEKAIDEPELSSENTSVVDKPNIPVAVLSDEATTGNDNSMFSGAAVTKELDGSGEVSLGEQGRKRKRDDSESDREDASKSKRRGIEPGELSVSAPPEKGSTTQSESRLEASESKADDYGSCDSSTPASDEKVEIDPQHERTTVSPDFVAALQASLPELDRFKMRLYVASSRAYRGRGAERRFADYWTALARFISVRLNGRDANATRCLNDARDVVESFLSTKQLRKLHNKLILAIMERCLHEHVLGNNLHRHVPMQWRGRAKSHRAAPTTEQPAEKRTVSRLKPASIEESQGVTPWAFDLGVTSAIWSAGGVGERAPYGPPAITVPGLSYLSEVEQLQAAPASSQLTSSLPGALSIDRLMKGIAKSKDLGVASNAVWLLVIAVREYTASILRNTISGIEALDHDQNVPRELITQPILHLVKRGQKKSASSKSTTNEGGEDPSLASSLAVSPRKLTFPGEKRRRSITPIDIATFLASTPMSVGASLGGSTSRMAFERCYASSFDTNPVSRGQDLDVVNGFISSCIRATTDPALGVSPVPRIPRPSAITGRASSGLGRGAKNLAALRARAATKPAPASEDSPVTKNAEVAQTMANALSGPSSSTPVNLDPSSNAVIPISNDLSTISGQQPSPSCALMPNASSAGEERVESPGVRVGRGSGIKNLAALRSRSITKLDVNESKHEGNNIAPDQGAPGGSTASQNAPESTTPTKKAEGKQPAASVIGGKQLTLLRMAEERRKHLGEAASTAVQPNSNVPDPATVPQNNVEQVLPSEGPKKETVLAPAVHVHGNADGTS